MKKLDKKDLLVIIIIFALFSAFIAAFAAISVTGELFGFTSYRNNNTGELYESFKQVQKPLAVIMLAGVLCSFGGIAFGITALSVKNKNVKTVCVVAVAAIAAVILILVIVAHSVYMDYYKIHYKDEFAYGGPFCLSSGNTTFALYSSISSALMSFAAIFVALSALTIAYLVIFLKENKKSVKETIADKTEEVVVSETE